MTEAVWDTPPATFKKRCYICGKQGEIKTADLNGLSAEQIWITIAFRRWFCDEHYPNTPEREQTVKDKEDTEKAKEDTDYQFRCEREEDYD